MSTPFDDDQPTRICFYRREPETDRWRIETVDGEEPTLPGPSLTTVERAATLERRRRARVDRR